MRSVLRCFCVFVLFLLSFTLSAQTMKISGARITTGAKKISVLPHGAGAYLCFRLENTGDKDEYVIVSIRSEEAQGKDQYFSAEFFAPAKSVQLCQFPFQLDGSESYTISAGGSAEITTPEVNIQKLSGAEYLNLTVTDSPFYAGFFSINSYNSLKGFPEGCLIENAVGDALPMSAHQLEHYRAILLYKTDFGKWHAKSFDAVAEYVRNGGTLCFGTPQDAYNALKTPLAELVPVKFSGTKLQQRSSSSLLKTKEYIPLLSMPGQAVDGASKMSGMPGFFEKKVGKGIVRASVFDIGQSMEKLAGEGYGKKLGAFFAGTAIPARPIIYTHTRLQQDAGPFFAFPQGRKLIAVLLVLFVGILLFYVAEIVLRHYYGEKIKKIYVYAAILIWGAGILLLGCVRGGLLFDWVPLPGGEPEVQQNGQIEK